VDNKQDSCTKYDTGNIILTSGTLSKDLIEVEPVSGHFEDGETRIMVLTAPGLGNQGTIHVEYDIFPWLEYDWSWNGVDAKLYSENPSATATFGLFRGNDRVIQIREIYD
jgi:MSHA biogenesis protein MshQ